MALTRVFIETDNDPPQKIQANANSRVFFNPNQYQMQRRVEWKETKSNGMDLPGLQFVSGGARSLSMSLVFDTYEAGDDVRKQTGQIAKLAEVDGKKQRPPFCTITWGPDAGNPYAGLPFHGVVESVSQKFTLFLDDGTPVRATVDVQFKEGQSVQKQLKRNPRARSSPLQPRTRTVREGDTLWSIAAAEYGDAAKWRSLARANQITNPRVLPPGTVLLIPSEE